MIRGQFLREAVEEKSCVCSGSFQVQVFILGLVWGDSLFLLIPFDPDDALIFGLMSPLPPDQISSLCIWRSRINLDTALVPLVEG